MIIKKSLILTAGLSISLSAGAYNHTPLSPSWFKNVYENVSENRDTVWRGHIIEVLNPTQILIEDSTGKVTVNLLHLTLKKGATPQDVGYSMRSLEAMIGTQVYILSNRNKTKVSAKIIDASGNDINLSLVESGAFDINTTSLHLKYEKQQYINALSNAKSSKIGIWH